MKNLLIITSLFILGFVSSCKKDEVVTPTKSKTEYLIAKTWIVSTVTAAGGAFSVYKRGNTAANNYIDLDKVSLKFNADGTITGTDNTGKAFSGAKWSLSTDETKLTLSGTGITGLDGQATLVQVTDTVLQVKGTITAQGLTGEGDIIAIPQ